eukprot:TRINITY_DN25444_c0_g1_i1.p1 TRINITY_DN25444_c0_g1~~TRINITY_DN25444_c0_g1_i1.p1  ORF type:complete len:521 (+),score=174.98 TRINITY_DN25444_c0_g1_i1:43-1605(+)
MDLVTPLSLPSPAAERERERDGVPNLQLPAPQVPQPSTPNRERERLAASLMVQPTQNSSFLQPRVANRRRAGSQASVSSPQSVSSIYEARLDEMAKNKEKEVERIKARLREALDDAAQHEEHAVELEDQCQTLTAQLALATQEARDHAEELERLQAEGMRSIDLRRRHSLEMHESRKDTLALQETAARAEIEHASGAEAQAHLASFALGTLRVTRGLAQENSAYRKQIKDMQLRLDTLRELGESLKQQQQRPVQQDPMVSERLEQAAADAAFARRELDDAYAALRGERANAAAHLERASRAEAARDAALRQLAELPDLERQVDHLARSKLGEATWLADKQHIEALLQQRNLEVASLTRKRDRAKRREQDALAEVGRLKALLDAPTPQCHPALPAHTPRSVSAPTGCSGRAYPHYGTAGPGGGAVHPPPAVGDGTDLSLADFELLQSHSGAPQDAYAASLPSASYAPLPPAAQEPDAADKDAEIAFLRARVRELTHQGRYAAGFSTPSLAPSERHLVPVPP